MTRRSIRSLERLARIFRGGPSVSLTGRFGCSAGVRAVVGPGCRVRVRTGFHSRGRGCWSARVRQGREPLQGLGDLAVPGPEGREAEDAVATGGERAGGGRGQSQALDLPEPGGPGQCEHRHPYQQVKGPCGADGVPGATPEAVTDVEEEVVELPGPRLRPPCRRCRSCSGTARTGPRPVPRRPRWWGLPSSPPLVRRLATTLPATPPTRPDSETLLDY